jgi:large subunit ribosomal protein L3
VLKMENVQVLAHRTDEKNGYTALQLGAGKPQAEPRHPCRAGKASPFPRSSPSASWPSSRVSPDNVIEVGAEITADHFVKGQHVDVTGTNQGKGFQGAMKRWEFFRLARHPRRLGHAPQPRLDRPAPRSRQGPSRARRWPAIWATCA